MSRNGRNPKSPAFQLYPTDFLSDPKVLAMSTEEVGVYCLLLLQGWLDGGIPNDMDQLARRVRLSPSKFARAWATVRHCWIESENGRLVNPRQERERLFQVSNRERLNELSKKGNAARWKADSGSRVGSHKPPKPSAPVPDARTRRPKPVPDAQIPTPGVLSPADKPPETKRKPLTGPNADCAAHWCSEWERTRGSTYSMPTKDYVAIATMLKDHPIEDVLHRMTAMLEDQDAWVLKSASPAILQGTKWNSYGIAARNGMAWLYEEKNQPRTVDVKGEVR